MNLKQYLTVIRTAAINDPIALAWRDGPQMKLFEQKYGRYMYLPLDIPRIEPNDKVAFKQWWVEASKPIKKTKADISGTIDSYHDAFNGVNSLGSSNENYDVNVRPEMFDLFPEIKAGLAAFPFDKPPEFTIWSSTRALKAHRDSVPVRDLPCAFRVMLYDENPMPTLYLKENPTDEVIAHNPTPNSQEVLPGSFVAPNISATNSFAWNNIRTVHYSIYDPAYMKCIVIIRNALFNLDKYEDLLIRSIEKYKDYAFVSANAQSKFVDG